MHTEMWEHPATRANVATLRGARRRRPRPGQRPAHRRRHRARAGCPSRRRSPRPPSGLLSRGPAGARRPRRAAGRRLRRRHPRAARPGALPRQPVLRSAGVRARRRRPPPAAPRSPWSPRTPRCPARRGGRRRRRHARSSCGRRCSRPPPDADVVVMAAAVADFRPAEVAEHKIKKTARPGRRARRPAGAQPGHPRRARRRPTAAASVVVGFAAETGDDVRRRADPRPRQARAQGLRPARRQRRVRRARSSVPSTTRSRCSTPTAAPSAVPRGRQGGGRRRGLGRRAGCPAGRRRRARLNDVTAAVSRRVGCAISARTAPTAEYS